MARKSVRPNVRIEKIYMKGKETIGVTVGVLLNTNQAIQLGRELVEAVEKANGRNIDLTLYPKRKTPVFTVTWME